MALCFSVSVHVCVVLYFPMSVHVCVCVGGGACPYLSKVCPYEEACSAVQRRNTHLSQFPAHVVIGLLHPSKVCGEIDSIKPI